MKILFVTPPPYLPNRLHRIRSFDLIKILSKNNEVYLFSVVSNKKEPSEFKEIKKLCRSVTIVKLPFYKSIINCLRFLYLPYEVAFCYSKEVENKIKETIKKEKIDLIYLKRLRSAIFLPQVSIPVIIDTTDAMSMFYYRMFQKHTFPKNLFYFFEGVKYKWYEKKMMKKIKDWIVCSEVDKKCLKTVSSSTKIEVVSNPVDVNLFKYQLITNHQSQIANYSLLFRGIMNKPVNIDAVLFFAHKIFPLIKKEIKAVKLFIVGPNPSLAVRKLGNSSDIFVTGFVKDVRKTISDSTVVICPIRIGSGTRHKILQAWVMRKPVVSTTIGAEGLMYKDNENILIADDPETFAQKILLLFKNKKLYTKLAQNGRRTVEKNYSLESVEKKLESIIGNVKKGNTKN